MSLAGMLDPTKAGRLPIVLSDALLGKEPKETYTAIKYNHKPTLSSSAAPSKARLKPEGSSDDGYDLTFRDGDGQYAYQGTRTTDDSKYVLIYDPSRDVLVLHKVDSTFNMNLTQTPDNNNPESLARKYPHLEGSKSISSSRNANTKKTAPPTTTTTTSKPKPAQKKGRDLAFPPPKAKPAKQPQATQSSSSAAKQTRPAVTTPDSENEDSSDDDLLQIEEPGGGNAPPASARDFSPAFGVRRFSDFVQQNTEEEDDADGEDDDDNQSIEHFTLPSPVNRQMEESAGLLSHREANNHDARNDHNAQQFGGEEEEAEESDEDADAEMEDVGQPAADSGAMEMDEDADLEAELMAAFEEEAQDQAESDVSEEE